MLRIAIAAAIFATPAAAGSFTTKAGCMSELSRYLLFAGGADLRAEEYTRAAKNAPEPVRAQLSGFILEQREIARIANDAAARLVDICAAY